MRLQRFVILLCPVTIAVALAAAASHAEPPMGGMVRIGMLSSMFKDVNPVMFKALATPFYSMVESQTGLKSELLLVPTPDEMRQQLEEGKIQFGVFHGFEFAWMKLKQPALQPLMIAAPQYRPLRSHLVVHTSSTATSFADLKGKTVSVPHGSREFSTLFLTRSCIALGQPPEAFFSQINAPKTAEDALHDVADNTTVQAAVVDGSALQCFADRNPGRSKRIKVIVTSEIFPPGVVAYCQGQVDENIVTHFRDGMGQAHTTPLGRQLLSLWLMTGFEPIPADFTKTLADIAKVYPPPGEATK